MSTAPALRSLLFNALVVNFFSTHIALIDIDWYHAAHPVEQQSDFAFGRDLAIGGIVAGHRTIATDVDPLAAFKWLRNRRRGQHIGAATKPAQTVDLALRYHRQFALVAERDHAEYPPKFMENIPSVLDRDENISGKGADIARNYPAIEDGTAPL